jgi:hypothetical protein
VERELSGSEEFLGLSRQSRRAARVRKWAPLRRRAALSTPRVFSAPGALQARLQVRKWTEITPYMTPYTTPQNPR